MAGRDVVLAAGALLVGVAGLAVSDEPGTRAPDVLAYVLLVLAALPLLAGGARPVGALLATTAVVLVYFGLDYPGGPVTPMPLAALYQASSAGRRTAAFAVAGLFVVGGSAFRLLVDRDPLVEVLLNDALFVLVLLLGDVVASRRALRAEVGERLRRAAEDQAREARERVARERLHIARELHDVLAHTVATMTVQAGAAADLLDHDPAQARAALGHIRRAAREASVELHATISLLRDDGDAASLPPAPAFGQLDELVAGTRRAGVHVEVETAGTPRPLPAAVELTAYRIMQEALTNVVRHAGASRVQIALGYQPDRLELVVEDDGRGPGGASANGYGLRGLRERVDALGGTIMTGPSAAGGFRLSARLPVAGERP